jgi:prepilin-type N-terminal cleavage/methylation domain-containing protein
MKNSFTLIELLVVMGIISLFFLISIPSFRAYQPSLQLSGTVRDLVTDLRYAGQLSVDEQVNHGIRFNIAANKYEIIRFGETEEVLETKLLSSEVELQQISGLSGNQVIFNPYGAAQEAGIVTLINSDNTTSSVDIRPSGFVKVIK